MIVIWVASLRLALLTYIRQLHKDIIDRVKNVWMTDDVTAFASTNRVGNLVDTARVPM